MFDVGVQTGLSGMCLNCLNREVWSKLIIDFNIGTSKLIYAYSAQTLVRVINFTFGWNGWTSRASPTNANDREWVSESVSQLVS